MGFTLTAAPKKRIEKNSTPREKTASGDFFQNPNESRLENRPQPLKTQQGTRAYSYKIVSGRPSWPSRDPLGEMGHELMKEAANIEKTKGIKSLNAYLFVENSPLNAIDVGGEWPTWGEVADYLEALFGDEIMGGINNGALGMGGANSESLKHIYGKCLREHGGTRKCCEKALKEWEESTQGVGDALTK